MKFLLKINSIITLKISNLIKVVKYSLIRIVILFNKIQPYCLISMMCYITCFSFIFIIHINEFMTECLTNCINSCPKHIS